MFSKVSRSALLLALVVGCTRTPSPSAVTPAQAPLTMSALAGDYTLVSVDGRALPYKADASARPVTSGKLTLGGNGTFQIQTVFDAPGASSAAASGACYPEGDQLKMVWDGGGLTNITVRGDTLVLKREGALYGYLRTR